MPDSKITALTSISTSTDPANDPLVIVDVSDTSMAATGTTKKVTLNNLLACSPTAGGNFTITGDLTVDTNVLKVDTTNNVVGIGTATPNDWGAKFVSLRSTTGISYTGVWNDGVNSPRLEIGHTSTGSYLNASSASGGSYSRLRFQVAGADQYQIDTSGVFTWYDGAGGTRMTLNSTGLGVGASPTTKLDVLGSGDGELRLRAGSDAALIFSETAANKNWKLKPSGGDFQFQYSATAYNSGYSPLMMLTAAGNVGIGVTPSAWQSSIYKVLELSRGVSLSGQTDSASMELTCNAYIDSGFLWTYKTTAAATHYRQFSGQHQWYTAPSGTAGNAITFTQAMTLDASGNLLVGTTAAAAGRLDVRRTTVGRGINYFSTASGDLAQVGLYVAKYDNDSTTSQKFIAFSINNDSAGSGQINANGANQAAFGSFSDSRLKENIVSLPSQLDNILSLRPVEFDYKDGSGHQIGFVAQEMQQVYSDAVGESDGFLTVTGWSKTEARLVSAIKELAAKVQALEAKLA